MLIDRTRRYRVSVLTSSSGCGVTLASESWELEVTVQLCLPGPKRLLAVGRSSRLQTKCSRSSTGWARRFERRGCGFESHRELQTNSDWIFEFEVSKNLKS